MLLKYKGEKYRNKKLKNSLNIINLLESIYNFSCEHHDDV